MSSQERSLREVFVIDTMIALFGGALALRAPVTMRGDHVRDHARRGDRTCRGDLLGRSR